MSDEIDLSFLDRPEILQVIFPVVYSSFQLPDFLRSRSAGVPACSVEVEEGIKIVCGFWVSGKDHPSILYFHGNGETVDTHEWIAPYYNRRGINLFVSDYRGYGASDGRPTISNMVADAHTIFRGFREKLREEGFKDSLFVMGRSLGSVPAVEVVLNYQDDIRGLIVESGTANNFRRLWDYPGVSPGITAAGEERAFLVQESPFLNKVKVRRIHRPTLIIHGENDEIMPVEEGKELYRSSGSREKRILVVPGAGHNDIMMNQELYFDTIEGFIREHQ